MSFCFATGLCFQQDMTNLRRSTRQRRVSVNLDDYTDSSGSDADLMVRVICMQLRDSYLFNGSLLSSCSIGHDL